MTEWTMGDTCGDCLLYSMCDDRACENKDSEHYQHVLGKRHPACEHIRLEIKDDQVGGE